MNSISLSRKEATKKTSSNSGSCYLSVVIPIYNEEEDIKPLSQSLEEELEKLKKTTR